MAFCKFLFQDFWFGHKKWQLVIIAEFFQMGIVSKQKRVILST
jgi:hypothetical protein